MKTEDAKSRDSIQKSEQDRSKNSEHDPVKKEPKLSKEKGQNTRRSQVTVGESRDETDLARVEPLLREESQATSIKQKNLLKESYEGGLSTIGLGSEK